MKNEQYNGHCTRCGQTFSDCAQLGCTSLLPGKEPDWDKMLEEIHRKMESPYFYLIEKNNSAGLYLNKKENGLTRSIWRALRFYGKDGKGMANLYLYMNQELGNLKDFIVTEHEFV